MDVSKLIVKCGDFVICLAKYHLEQHSKLNKTRANLKCLLHILNFKLVLKSFLKDSTAHMHKKVHIPQVLLLYLVDFSRSVLGGFYSQSFSWLLVILIL